MFSTDSTVLSLESVLEDPSSDLFKEFAAYLHQSYCIENLAFWIATQEYHHQECNHLQLCESMINLYIRPNSPQEINIPCDMRQTILDYYYQGNCHVHIFDEAAEAVLELMRVNSFLPWITSSTSSSSCSCSPPTSSWSFDYQSPSNYNSWPSPPLKKKPNVIHSPSTNSLSDKWNMMKLKQMSRRSCSSLDYSIDDTNNNALDSVTSATSTTSGTRYRSMLKRVKRSLLGHHHTASSSSSNEDEDDYSTPRTSFTDTTTSWRKSQR
jgi:hypothetical protein